MMGSCNIDHIDFLVGIVGGEYFGLSEGGDDVGVVGVDVGEELPVMSGVDVVVVEEDVSDDVAVEGGVFVGSVEMFELVVELVAQQFVHPVVHLTFELVFEYVECAEFVHLVAGWAEWPVGVVDFVSDDESVLDVEDRVGSLYWPFLSYPDP